MKERIRKHTISFKNAYSGIKWAFTTQPNFLVHILLSSLVVSLGLIFGMTRIEWAIIIMIITLGLAAEMINTALEAACDAITSEWHKEIKIAKDVAAGMMLIVAIGALVVAYIIFLPKLTPLL